MIRKFVLPLTAGGMLLFAVYHMVLAQQKLPLPEPPVPPVHSPFDTGVAGAGLVEAQTENIAVGSNLSGIVHEVYVKVSDKVVKGQKLFRLDDRTLKAERSARAAALESSRKHYEKLKRGTRPEEIPAYEARLAERKANLAEQEDLAQRARRLHAQRATPDEERTRREQALSMAREQVRKAAADLALLKAGTWQPDLEIAAAAVVLAETQLKQIDTSLEQLTVTALQHAEVLQVKVRPGEYVNASGGSALIMLGDLTRLHVRVDIDEFDIPRFEPGAPARAFLRGDSRQDFHLEFVRVEPYVLPKRSLTGDNTERVDTRVLQVIYQIAPSQRRVYVGQQLDVYIENSARKK